MRGNSRPADRGRGDRSASGRRSSACPTSPTCGSTPRSTSRWSTGSPRACPARIKVDALPNVSLTGTVKAVQPLPDPTQLLQLGREAVHDPRLDRQLRLGPAPRHDGPGRDPRHPARRRAHVPVQSVIQAQGKEYVYRHDPRRAGPPSEVKLGITNEKMIEVKEGLKVGDEVAMNWNVADDRGREERPVLPRPRARPRARIGRTPRPPTRPNLADRPRRRRRQGRRRQGRRRRPRAATRKAKAKGRGGRGGAGGFKMFPTIPPSRRRSTRSPARRRWTHVHGTEEEKAAILKEAGLTDEEMKKYEDAMAQMRSA